MTTLHLMVGLPCSGKTTRAKELELELDALRLNLDEWHIRLFGQDAEHPDHDERHSRIEELQWEVAAFALTHGQDVILDFGLWARSERDAYRERAAALDAETVIHFLDVPHEELVARLKARNAGEPSGSFRIPVPMLADWIPLFEPPTADELALGR